MTTVLDPTTPFGRKAHDQLAAAQIGWVTTIAAAGTPQPNPVWFLWTADQSILLFSKPDAHRIAHLRDQHVFAFNLNTNASGGDVVILTGTGGAIDQAEVTSDELAQFNAKYAEGFVSLGGTAASFHAEYSVPIRLTPTKARGF